jgi:hypothetical protein
MIQFVFFLEFATLVSRDGLFTKANDNPAPLTLRPTTARHFAPSQLGLVRERLFATHLCEWPISALGRLHAYLEPLCMA